MTKVRAAIAVLLLGTGCTILLAGSGSACKSGFCVDISSSFYSKEACAGSPTEQCTYANVYFTAKSNNVNVINLTESGVEMLINDRPAGVEGTKKLTTSNGLVVQLLLDKSYSITESDAGTAVRNGASQFVRSLSEAALISVSVFASEDTVPSFLSPNGTSSTSDQVLYNKATAESIVQQFYSSYPGQTSLSQTKLYDAVGRLGGLSPTGNGAERLQTVMVVFTDGADTASSQFRTPAEVRAQLSSESTDLKVYAIGLGTEPSAEALGTISDNRFYRAVNALEVQTAFDSVSKELTAIYLFKVLVSGVESNAKGRLKVTHEGISVEQTFSMSSQIMEGVGGGGGTGGTGGTGGSGGSGGTGGTPVIVNPTTTTTTIPVLSTNCTSSTYGTKGDLPAINLPVYEGTTAVTGLTLRYDASYYFGEPTQRAVIEWQGTGSLANIQWLAEVQDVAQGRQFVTAAGKRVYASFDVGVIKGPGLGFGSNTTGSPSWSQTFVTYDNATGIAYGVTETEAKNIYKACFQFDQVRVVRLNGKPALTP